MPLANHAEDKVRRLQVKLYQAAKRSPGRRFHASIARMFCTGRGNRYAGIGVPRE